MIECDIVRSYTRFKFPALRLFWWSFSRNIPNYAMVFGSPLRSSFCFCLIIRTALQFRGGAICSYGSLNLMGGSFFHDNYASGFGDGGSGGAIYNGEYAFLS